MIEWLARLLLQITSSSRPNRLISSPRFHLLLAPTQPADARAETVEDLSTESRRKKAPGKGAEQRSSTAESFGIARDTSVESVARDACQHDAGDEGMRINEEAGKQAEEIE